MIDRKENSQDSYEPTISYYEDQKQASTEEETVLADHEKNSESMIEEGAESFTIHRGLMFCNDKNMISLLKPVDICDIPTHIGITILHNPKKPHHGVPEGGCLNHLIGVYINRATGKPAYMVWFNASQNKEHETADAILEKKVHATYAGGKPEEAGEMLTDDFIAKVKSAKVYVSLNVLALELALSPHIIKFVSDLVQEEIDEMIEFWAKLSV
jgi:hypothetical protein